MINYNNQALSSHRTATPYLNWLLRAIPPSGVDTAGIIGYVTETFYRLILAGVLREGDRLPTELALSEHLEVSKKAVHGAYSTLVKRGVVAGKNNEGTYLVSTLPVLRARLEDTVALAQLLGHPLSKLRAELNAILDERERAQAVREKANNPDTWP